MSAGTSVLGMVPLAIFPRQGSELYQGLGIALTGGLAFSTILTPTVVPALMALLHDIDYYTDYFSNTNDTNLGRLFWSCICHHSLNSLTVNPQLFPASKKSEI
jgi:AcrB/AcrD/AcrF family